MQVAPNQSQVQARVLAVEQSPQFRDRWNLTVEILQVEPVRGGTFIETGQIIKAFTISESVLCHPDDVIAANAEYLGGPSGGWLQLMQISLKQ